MAAGARGSRNRGRGRRREPLLVAEGQVKNIFFSCRDVREKSKFCRKIQILVKNPNFGEN